MISNAVAKVRRNTWRLLYSLSRARPVSYPFISGDGFRALADVKWEQPFPVSALGEKRAPCILYCESWYLKAFLVDYAKTIQVPFVLISCNGDTNFNKEFAELLPENLLAGFIQNLQIVHPKLFALPIGLENRNLHYNGIPSQYLKIRKREAPHLNRILCAFSEGNNPEIRVRAQRTLSKLSTVDNLERTNAFKYRNIASKYRFIASPPGNGEDCHRTWEAMYCRSVPIVLRSAMMEQFVELGLPVWCVDSYDEVQNMNEQDLNSLYKSFSLKFEAQVLWAEFWKKRISDKLVDI